MKTEYELREQFEDECRELWRSTAAAYAADGQYSERMKTWADRAVSDYRKTFEPALNARIAALATARAQFKDELRNTN